MKHLIKDKSYYGEACYKCWKNKGLKLITNKDELDEFYRKLEDLPKKHIPKVKARIIENIHHGRKIFSYKEDRHLEIGDIVVMPEDHADELVELGKAIRVSKIDDRREESKQMKLF